MGKLFWSDPFLHSVTFLCLTDKHAPSTMLVASAANSKSSLSIGIFFFFFLLLFNVTVRYVQFARRLPVWCLQWLVGVIVTLGGFDAGVLLGRRQQVLCGILHDGMGGIAEHASAS